jgi:hypothetical protein
VNSMLDDFHPLETKSAVSPDTNDWLPLWVCRNDAQRRIFCRCEFAAWRSDGISFRPMMDHWAHQAPSAWGISQWSTIRGRPCERAQISSLLWPWL